MTLNEQEKRNASQPLFNLEGEQPNTGNVIGHDPASYKQEMPEDTAGES